MPDRTIIHECIQAVVGHLNTAGSAYEQGDTSLFDDALLWAEDALLMVGILGKPFKIIEEPVPVVPTLKFF